MIFDLQIAARTYKGPKTLSLRDVDIAWIAGIVEGEGCITMFSDARKELILGVRIKVSMTDRDIIERLHSLVPGSVLGKMQRPSHGNKPYSSWTINRRELVYEMLELLLPWLGIRRSGRAKEVMSAIERADPNPEKRCCARNSIAKLTDEQVREIRAKIPHSRGVDLAREYKVAFQTISKIKHRKSWSTLQ